MQCHAGTGIYIKHILREKHHSTAYKDILDDYTASFKPTVWGRIAYGWNSDKNAFDHKLKVVHGPMIEYELIFLFAIIIIACYL